MPHHIQILLLKLGLHEIMLTLARPVILLALCSLLFLSVKQQLRRIFYNQLIFFLDSRGRLIVILII